MLKYLAGAVIGAAAVYGALEIWVLSNAGPEFRVTVKQTHIPPNGDPYDLLVVTGARPLTPSANDGAGRRASAQTKHHR